MLTYLILQDWNKQKEELYFLVKNDNWQEERTFVTLISLEKFKKRIQEFKHYYTFYNMFKHTKFHIVENFSNSLVKVDNYGIEIEKYFIFGLYFINKSFEEDIDNKLVKIHWAASKIEKI